MKTPRSALLLASLPAVVGLCVLWPVGPKRTASPVELSVGSSTNTFPSPEPDSRASFSQTESGCAGCAHCSKGPAPRAVVPKDPSDLGSLVAQGETLRISPRVFADLKSHEVGDEVRISRLGGADLTGEVTMAHEKQEHGWWIRSVALRGFENAVLSVHGGSGRPHEAEIFSRSSETAFVLSSLDADAVSFQQVERTDVVPDCGTEDAADQAGVPYQSSSSWAFTLGYPDGIPLFESLPGAKNVIYLDVDGETVSGTHWNAHYFGGKDKTVANCGLTRQEIEQIWRAVKEDFRPFNVNVTTDRTVYDAADTDKRMMAILTTTNWRGSRGVANLSSFGTLRAPVCWVFTSAHHSINGKARTCSHEVGHTLSLKHDGRTVQTVYPSGQIGYSHENYFSGHGDGELGWTPIMGNGDKAVSQWSRGDYNGADNREDDVQIIADWLGFIEDEAGSDPQSAAQLGMTNETMVSHAGVISSSRDQDVYRLEVGTGLITLDFATDQSEQEGISVGGNLDVFAVLVDEEGNRVAGAYRTGFLSHRLYAEVEAGTYYLHVVGNFFGDHGWFFGWNRYGSLGTYYINGSVPPALQEISDGFAAWKANHFGVGAIEEDGDEDGIPLIMEYALGLDPTKNSSRGMPKVELVEAGGDQFLSLKIGRELRRPDVHYVVESSSDLQSWTQVSEVIVDSEELLQVRDSQPMSAASRRFIRLRVEWVGASQ